MFKKGLGQVLGLGLVLILFFAYAFAEESFTITTYYPSPYGSYNQLEVHRSVTYKPVDKDTLSSPSEGELVYNASDDSLYLYNGSTWVAQGGAAGSVLYLACPWGSDYSAGENQGWGNQCGASGTSCCTPAACPSGWTSVATYPEPVSLACPGYTGPCYWADAVATVHPVAVGRTVRACVKN